MTSPYSRAGKRKAGSFWWHDKIAKHHHKKIECFDCGATQKLERDHKKPLSQGGWDELENLQLLCQKCHRIKSVWEQKQFKPKTKGGDFLSDYM